jgi:hypothetical protein
MIANDYWAHDAPDGTTPWFFVAQAGYDYLSAGENLAHGFATSDETVNSADGWMNSPLHRANIMNASYEEVGFGIANGANFQGGESTVVVAMYGDPVDFTPPAPEPAPEEPAAPVSQTPASNETPIAETNSTQEEPEEEVAAEDEPEDLPQINIPSISTFGSPPSDTPEPITQASAFFRGDGNWSIQFSALVLMVLASIYTARHVVFIQSIVIRGEHAMHAHPLLEASVVYAALWVVLTAQYGVIQ